MTHQPDWYKLIYGWCRLKKRRGNGITIPFAIGALENDSIGDLLFEIRDTETEEKVILQFCSDRKEYVLSVDDIEYPFAQTLPHYGQLYIYDDTDRLEALPDFEAVVQYLNERYAPRISAGEYSINMTNNEWGPYSEEDLKFIKKVLWR